MSEVFGEVCYCFGGGIRFVRLLALVGITSGLLYVGCYSVRRTIELPYHFALETKFPALPLDD